MPMDSGLLRSLSRMSLMTASSFASASSRAGLTSLRAWTITEPSGAEFGRPDSTASRAYSEIAIQRSQRTRTSLSARSMSSNASRTSSEA
jgi:hypothetical protein